jgi:hypothetical protein
MSFTILAIGVLAFVGAFIGVAKSVHVSKCRAVANNLLQEKIEAMKDISYYRILPTTAPVSSTESGIATFQYDNGFYPPETVTVGDIQYTRRVLVEKVSSAGGGAPVVLGWQAPDSGLKRIRSFVLWQDRGVYRMMELQNLINNPNRVFLNGTVRGTVSVSAGSPTGATVMTAQNASWFDQASSAGAYSFSVAPGSYTLTASLPGYFPKTIDGVYVASNSSYTWNTTLTQMSSGTVTGTAYIRDHLVMSRVAANIANGGFNQEYVELYNPTTWTWTVGGALGLKYWNRNVSLRPIAVTYTNTTIAPNGFFLFANTTTVRVNGTNVTADALWTVGGTNEGDFSSFLPPADPNILRAYTGGSGKGEGALILYRISDGTAVDTLGWKGGGGGSVAVPTDFETTPVNETNGLEDDEQYYRRYQSGSGLSLTVGPAYDGNNNDLDWEREKPTVTPPRSTTTGILPPTTGTPASGAYVSADDGLSDPTQCASDGSFSLTAVATGSWSVAFSSSALYVSTPAAITANGQVLALGGVGITSATTSGFVTGFVRSAVSNAALNGITVQSAAGTGIPSGASGRYTLTLTPGLTSLTANPGNLSNGSYVSQTIDGVVIATGVYTTGVDFTLDTGGKITGYVAIGGNPLPGISVTATDSSGVVGAESASDANGAFSLRNLSTGTYTVDLQLESGETYTPGTTTTTIATAGQSVFAASFTVTSAFGYVTGSLTASGKPLKTGALIVATTSTIAGATPPDITAAVRSGVTKYYAASSLSDGTYELHLPGGNPGTPTTYNVYAWYTTWTGTTPTTVKKTSSASVTGGLTASGVNFSW